MAGSVHFRYDEAMPTLNYSTKVPAQRTIAEIAAMLVRQGADAIATTYTDQLPTGLSFKLSTPHGPRAFSLPVDIDAVNRLLIAQEQSGEMRKSAGKLTSRDHAASVAWRVLKDWVAAQLAIIEAQMATLDQVMLPYLHVDGELTLYEQFRQSEQRAITAGATT